MKPKSSKPPTPRYHVFWKADKETDPKAYAAFKERLHRHFPFLDPKALDAARYFDGADNPNAVFYPGTITINEYLNRLEAEEQTESEQDFDETIMEGTRNSTMFRFAVRTLKRFGNSEEARERFRKEIFHLCVQGYGVSQIATAITSRHIMNPTAHAKANGINPPDNRKDAGEYYWGSSTISHILTRQEYLGHTVNFKTYRKSHKQKKQLHEEI